MHLALIMDGNRRWAQRQWLIKMLWHSRWGDNIDPTLELCLKENIDFVSFWVLAKKNLEERAPNELDHIYGLIRERLPRFIPKFLKNNVKFTTLGDLSMLPDDIISILQDAIRQTEHCTKLTCIFAINYWWQAEVIRGIKSFLRKNINQLSPENLEVFLENLDEDSFRGYLDCAPFPNPDLIVRTGWDIRHSGYWLYASEYSEYYFTDTLWPDFDETEFYKALDSLKGAKRNFGK